MRLTSELSRRAHQAGFACLTQGQGALCAVLDDLKTKFRHDRPYFSTDMGVFYVWLKSVSEEQCMQPIVDCVRSYVFENYPVKIGQDVLGRGATRQTLLTFDEARSRSGLGVHFLKKLLGHLDGLSDDDLDAATEISETDLTRVLYFWGGLFNLGQAAEFLAISRTEVKQLIRAGSPTAYRFGSALR